MLQLDRRWVLVLVPLVLAFTEESAEAYVDPGSASYVFQLIVGALLGGLFVLRTYWARLVTAIRSVVSRDAGHSE
jgi:hypothetical protein